MKTNAPEKIYLNPLLMEDGESVVRRCTFERQRDSQIEYTRTDAFIEKAKRWLEKNAGNYVWCSDYAENPGDDICGMDDDFVDDFVNYMKGE